MAYKVLKPIPKGDGTTIPAGTVVDASSWRNLRSLIGGRYLVEIADAIAPKAVKAEVAKPVEVVTVVEPVEEEKPRLVRKSRKRDEQTEE
jgi:hypothetical protein